MIFLAVLIFMSFELLLLSRILLASLISFGSNRVNTSGTACFGSFNCLCWRGERGVVVDGSGLVLGLCLGE